MGAKLPLFLPFLAEPKGVSAIKPVKVDYAYPRTTDYEVECFNYGQFILVDYPMPTLIFASPALQATTLDKPNIFLIEFIVLTLLPSVVFLAILNPGVTEPETRRFTILDVFTAVVGKPSSRLIDNLTVSSPPHRLSAQPEEGRGLEVGGSHTKITAPRS